MTQSFKFITNATGSMKKEFFSGFEQQLKSTIKKCKAFQFESRSFVSSASQNYGKGFN